jgi:hypothetical protein
LPRWTAAERAEILKRKIKLEKGKRK